jgi:hypothetical protein
MLTSGKVIHFYLPHNLLQPALRVARCCWPTLSTKSSSRPLCLSSEADHG